MSSLKKSRRPRRQGRRRRKRGGRHAARNGGGGGQSALFCAEKMPSNFHSNYLFNSLELIETKMRSILMSLLFSALNNRRRCRCWSKGQKRQSRRRRRRLGFDDLRTTFETDDA